MDMVPQREAAVKTHKKKRSNTMAMKPQSLSSCKKKIHKQRFIKRGKDIKGAWKKNNNNNFFFFPNKSQTIL
jgi:hypothetical protein